ncbi:helix-turn-helix domain-containing protein [Peristeroidobacter agariperforans]|uniref:helix-turn-helix domain-containing protein n=1 Tax=Peristeroidobacter agariperforans TaxID=268404 RepID=UPI00101D1E9F|nr:helix-turn-helix transcriptional regulator [Peristeroidobacter agariperforans]
MTEITPEQARAIAAIKAAPEKAGLTQRELSRMISNSHSVVQKMEDGTQHVRVIHLTAIASATKTDPIKLYRATLPFKECHDAIPL